jgi:uncharacterized protein with FMN-binding domain
MKRVALAIAGTVAALVMLLSFKTHTPAASTTPPAAVSSGTSTGSSTGSSSASSSPTTATGTKTYTGAAADTRYGPVQVQITVTNGKVVKATAVEYPMQDPRDAEINAYAIPRLQSETVSASSARIDMVSGATYTSEGYIQSLQSALDRAGR